MVGYPETRKGLIFAIKILILFHQKKNEIDIRFLNRFFNIHTYHSPHISHPSD